MTNSLPFTEMKCPACGWVHAAVPLSAVISDVGSPEEFARLFRCFNCGCPTESFMPAQPEDSSEGCTLQVVVVGEAPR